MIQARESEYGVIFDMDGVLVDSSEAHFAAWSRLGEELGVSHPRSIFERTFGMHNRQILPLWLGDRVTPGEIERLSERKEAMYREAAAATLQPIDGAVPLIHALAGAGFRLAVGSSAPRANVDLALELLRVREFFFALSTGDEVEHGKPHPEVFLNAASKLGLHPGRCVVVEDAPQGVLAGLAAGSRVIAVETSRPAAELAAAHWVVPSLRDVTAERVFDLLGGRP